MDEKNEEPIIGTPQPSGEFWRDNAKKMLGGSIESIENTAKQIIVVCAILEGIYFHAITYSHIAECIGTLTGIFYLAPLLLWLLSILAAVHVFSPPRRIYHINIFSERESKETFMQLAILKYKKLKLCEFIFFVSFVFLFIALGLYLCGC